MRNGSLRLVRCPHCYRPPPFNPVWMFTSALLPHLMQQQVFPPEEPSSSSSCPTSSPSPSVPPAGLILTSFVLTDTPLPPLSFFSLCRILTLCCWFLQEAVVVPTRAQEPVVPPTLIAVSTLFCFHLNSVLLETVRMLQHHSNQI